MADAVLDAGAENCGRLIGLIVEAMRPLQPGQTLHVRAYDPSSQLDVAAWSRLTGNRLQVLEPAADADVLEFLIEKAADAREAHHGSRHDQQHPRQR